MFQTYLDIDECIAGEIQRLQTDKAVQCVSQMSDLLLVSPREA